MRELNKKNQDLGFEIFNNKKPLYKLLRIKDKYFLYDTGTSKILECEPEIFNLLEQLDQCENLSQTFQNYLNRYNRQILEKSITTIHEAIKQENILQAFKIEKLGLTDLHTNLKEILSTSVQTITLEVTKGCNLDCIYCGQKSSEYVKADLKPQNMDLKVAKGAIDFLSNHSAKTELPAIGFYGGEPLLRFPFIKQCVEYAKRVFAGRNLMFNITTNATLVTPDIADYLIENKFSVVVSLDGPAEFHDQYRKKKDNTGSHRDTINGFNLLFDRYKTMSKGTLAFNMVYTPPYSPEKLNKIKSYIKDLELPQEINVAIVYPKDGSIPSKTTKNVHSFQPQDMLQWAMKDYLDNPSTSQTITLGLVEQKLAQLIQRPVFNQPIEDYFLNGCCVPGQRKNYIDTEGNILICEKISPNAPTIGNVLQGFDYKCLSQQYIRDFAKKSLSDCATCWAARLCNLCYVSAYNDQGKFDCDKKRENCHRQLRSLERSLTYLVTFIKNHPDKIERLYQYQIT